MNHKNFDWGYFLKHIAIIAVPVALQNLLTTTGSMVDTIMLASIGEKAVGAVGLCAQFSSLMFAGYWGFVGGGMLFFSQYWGARDHDGITRSYGMTLLFMMTVGVLFACLAIFAPEFVMVCTRTSRRSRKSGFLICVSSDLPIRFRSSQWLPVLCSVPSNR